jgi:flagellar biosynthesis/type III secretory pathway protein FliH
MQTGGLFGREKKESPPDGPARVVKPGDWGAVADAGMKGFQMTAFNMPGRAQPKPTDSELKIQDLTRSARKAEEGHKKALQKAVSDGEAAAQAAMAKGREEGMREGEARAWERYLEALEEMRGNAAQALNALSQEKAALFLEFEGQILELFSATVHRVFDGVAKEHSEAVLPLLRKAVSALGQAASVTLKVNPADARTVEENQDFWLPVDAGTKDIRVVSDERIPKGGCYVESDSTSVGIQADELAERIDEELKRIFAAKAQSLKNAESPASDAGEAEAGTPPEAGTAPAAGLAPGAG